MLWGIFQLGKTCKNLFWNFFENQEILRKFSAKILVKILCLHDFLIKSFQKSPERNYFCRKKLAKEALLKRITKKVQNQQFSTREKIFSLKIRLLIFFKA